MPRAAERSRSRSCLSAVVLVVEDNGVNRRIACEFLGRLGLCAESVEDGAAALAALDAAPEKFALVLMDIQMPGLDGFETTRRLRADPRFRSLPVVAITAHVLDQDRIRCLDAGMDDHLPKPFEPGPFTEMIGRWLGLELVWETGRDDGDRDLPVDGTGSMDTRTGRPLNNRSEGSAVTPLVSGDDGCVPLGGASDERRDGLVAPTQPRGTAMPAPPEPDLHGDRWIDFSTWEARFGGDAALYRRLLTEFQENYGPRSDLFGSGDAAERLDDIGRTAHMLRGTAPMVGADSLGRLAANVDDALKRGETPNPEAISALGAGLVDTLAAARDWTPPEPAGSPATTTAHRQPEQAAF